MIYFLLFYLIFINLFSFFLFGWDKRCAMKGRWRISEAALLLSAVLGGALGAMLGMKEFHHKTRHRKFRILVPLLLFVQIFFLLCFLWWK